MSSYDALSDRGILVEIEKHLTEQDKELKKSTEMGNWLAFLIFSGTVALLGTGLLLESKPWEGVVGWGDAIVIVVGIAGMCYAIRRMRGLERPSPD